MICEEKNQKKYFKATKRTQKKMKQAIVNILTKMCIKIYTTGKMSNTMDNVANKYSVQEKTDLIP